MRKYTNLNIPRSSVFKVCPWVWTGSSKTFWDPSGRSSLNVVVGVCTLTACPGRGTDPPRPRRKGTLESELEALSQGRYIDEELLDKPCVSAITGNTWAADVEELADWSVTRYETFTGISRSDSSSKWIVTRWPSSWSLCGSGVELNIGSP